MDEKVLLSKEDIVQKIAEESRKIAEVQDEKRKGEQLGKLLQYKTDGKIKLPKVTLAGMMLIESELGDLDNISLSSISNLATILWAILNQNNLDVLKMPSEARKRSVMDVANEIPISELPDYTLAIIDSMGLGGTEPKNSKPARQKKSV